MLYAYASKAARLKRLPQDAPLTSAVWIDLYRPQPEQVAAVEGLGVSVPSRDEMEEIELSSRLYREEGIDYMTVVMPGSMPDGDRVLAPVTFIVCDRRVITVRYHSPRPFETFPELAGRGALDLEGPAGTFLGLADEIIARFADILEEIGTALDKLSAQVFSESATHSEVDLRGALTTIGQVGDRVGRVRLGLLTMERALTFYGQSCRGRPDRAELEDAIGALQRDLSALGVHADFVYSRIGLVDDATLGLINLDQNATVRIFSIVAVLFMPPTLVASIYGMNFRSMPELDAAWGYPAALGVMVGSAALTYLFFRWKKWL